MLADEDCPTLGGDLGTADSEYRLAQLELARALRAEASVLRDLIMNSRRHKLDMLTDEDAVLWIRRFRDVAIEFAKHLDAQADTLDRKRDG